MTRVIRGMGAHKVLLLSAWFCTAESWGETVKWLDPDQYTIVTPDYQGHGTRRDETGDYSIRGIAEDMKAIVDELGWTSYSVVGHSMGGKVAQYIAATDERVGAVVGVVPVMPTPLSLSEEDRQFMFAAVQDLSLRPGIVAEDVPAGTSPYFAQKVAQESIDGTSVDAFEGHLRAWADDDITEVVKGCSTPIRILVGEHDSSITRAAMEELLLPFFPNAGIELLAGSGHYPNYEVPPTLASAIDRFLRPMATT